MELMHVLRNRRAVRDYTPQQVSRGTVENLINAAITAPSAMNLQPWAFAVLLDRARIDSCADRAKQWLLENVAGNGFGEEARHLLERPDFKIFYNAPALLLVMAKSGNSQAMEDCCLAAENLMLAARDGGMGSCWIGFARPWLNLKAIKEELSLPGDYEIVAPVVLGYPRAWPEAHGRNAAEIHWI
jgi:nitroreductase